MSSKLNLLGSAFLLASVLGLAPARAESVASHRQPDAATAAPAPSAKSRTKLADKHAAKPPAQVKEGDAANHSPPPAPAPSPEKMRELEKHPEARSGRGHL